MLSSAIRLGKEAVGLTVRSIKPASQRPAAAHLTGYFVKLNKLLVSDYSEMQRDAMAMASRISVSHKNQSNDATARCPKTLQGSMLVAESQRPCDVMCADFARCDRDAKKTREDSTRISSPDEQTSLDTSGVCIFLVVLARLRREVSTTSSSAAGQA